MKVVRTGKIDITAFIRIMIIGWTYGWTTEIFITLRSVVENVSIDFPRLRHIVQIPHVRQQDLDQLRWSGGYMAGPYHPDQPESKGQNWQNKEQDKHTN